MALTAAPTNERTTAWHLDLLGIPALWNAGITGAGVRVGLLDSGLARVRGLDRPGAFEYIDTRGSSTTANDSQTGHGTRCASIVASTDDRALGIAPDASIVSFQVTPFGDAVLNLEHALEAIARRGDIDVLLCAFAIASLPLRVVDQIGALAAAGIIIVTAAGDSDIPMGFPEDVLQAVSVAGITRDQRALPSARRGTFIHVAAPAEDVPALNPLGDVVPFGDTSAAAAIVAGVAALMMSTRTRSRRRELGARFRNLVGRTANPLSGVSPLAVGSGCVNPAGTLKLINEELR
ncbi:MAG TPA: S8 family serine peptidase [Kofleriaceae bacterium]|nr:S8 family serine peptidase [Kofleriaceae bacterium]